MPKYWGGNYFAHGRFPEVGQKQKTEGKKRKEEEEEEERLNDGDNNGQATHSARKHPWRPSQEAVSCQVFTPDLGSLSHKIKT